jgi:hypothetical protein
MISLAVELIGKLEDAGGAEFNAKTAAFAQLRVNHNQAPRSLGLYCF